MKRLFAQILIMPFVVLTACNERASSQSEKTQRLYETDTFKQYWYAGKAEVNSYNLSQSRYGENRPGKAMLIFVTEDFSRKKQVKLDDPGKAGDDKVSVLKLNFTKNFVTGIYPYSMMLSAFTPVSRNQYPNSLKFTMSSQEWCGHVFTQVNLKKDNYGVDSYSYFEQEGDTHFTLKTSLAEDEIMNIIRLDPASLPNGEVMIIPGLFFTRLKHENLKPLRASASKEEIDSEVKYSILFSDNERTLSFYYEKNFPHKITRWEETFTERGQKMTTRATLDKTLVIDYWTKNKSEFTHLRDSLHLPIGY
jgi:hypothetical protein